MTRKSIPKDFLKNKDQFLNYDFNHRKKRREKEGKFFMDLTVAKNNLLDIKDIFDENKLVFWLIYGTLLGAIRDHNFISFDGDTDIGIYEENRSDFIKVIPMIIDKGFDLIRISQAEDLVTFMRDDEYIDIGIFREESDVNGNKYYSYQNHKEYHPSFEELVDLKFLGRKFKISKFSYDLLSRWYGNDWKIKKRNFPAYNANTTYYEKIKRRIKNFLKND